MDIKYISKNIKHYRERFRLTQEKLAEILEVSPHYIYELERGTRQPSLKMLLQIAEIFHVTVDCLVSENISESNTENKLNSLISGLTNEQSENLYEILTALFPHLKL